LNDSPTDIVDPGALIRFVTFGNRVFSRMADGEGMQSTKGDTKEGFAATPSDTIRA